MNCKPGDLAVVVDAYNPTNIGSILRILRTHEDQAALLIEPGDHIWTMVATHPQFNAETHSRSTFGQGHR